MPGRAPRLHRTDANQGEVMAWFAGLGWAVCDTSELGRGFPDLVIGWGDTNDPKRWINVLIEVKADGGRLTEPEQAFHRRWPGPLEIVRGWDDVLRVHEKWRNVRTRA